MSHLYNTTLTSIRNISQQQFEYHHIFNEIEKFTLYWTFIC